jgi:pyruvate dehydrogenase E2 component (dihydrolipoamide acetyltransferase)
VIWSVAMICPIIIPKLGMTMSEATLVEWKAAEVDFVERSSVVLTIETEKVSWDIEAAASGFLHILVEKGKIARVGQVVGQIAETKDELETLQKEETNREAIGRSIEKEGLQTSAETIEPPSVKKASPASPAARSLGKKLGIDISLVPGSGPGGRVTEQDVVKYCNEKAGRSPKITPLANRIAEDVGLDVNTIEGTGDEGKITKQDVIKAIDTQLQRSVSESNTKAIPLTGMRKTIAKAMFDSIHMTAQASVFTEVDVTEMLDFYHKISKEFKEYENIKVSLTDIMIMATCRALKQFPTMNSTLNDDEIIIYDSVNMGIAVALPQGLIVPVLKNADKKRLLEIVHERQKLVINARDGKLMVDDVVGGTFTISNISMFNVDGATPILRRPENGILAFGKIKKKPAVYQNQIVIRSIMVISLTFDHQAIDGAPAAQFLSALCHYFENPYLILL